VVREVAYARKRNPLSDLNKILQGGRYPNVVTYANFGEDWLRGLWVAGGQSLPFSIDFDCRPYNTLALPCECVILINLVFDKSRPGLFCYDFVDLSDSEIRLQTRSLTKFCQRPDLRPGLRQVRSNGI